MSATFDDLVAYQKAWARFGVALEGKVEVDAGIEPSHASVSRRSHNQGDTAEVTIHASAIPFDPRQLGGAFLALFMGSVESQDADVARIDFLQFVGFVDEMPRTLDEKGPSIVLKARGLDALLRDFKPVPPSAHPRYTDTVGSAINRILSSCPNVVNNGNGPPRLTLRETALTERPLFQAVSTRAHGSPVQFPQDTNAWAMIEHICGLVNLFVYLELDEITVVTPADVYSHNRPTVVDFVFGSQQANLLLVEDTKKFVRNRKGVRVNAYDPITHQRMTAVYPPDSQLTPQRIPRSSVRGHTRAVAPTRPTSMSNGPDREVFPAPTGHYTQDGLNGLAERIFVERNRQEIEGRIQTPFWTPAVLNMRNGDRFSMRINPDLEAELRRTTSEQARVNLLVTRTGMSDVAARAMLGLAANRPVDDWYTKNVTIEYAGQQGKNSVTVDYMNNIHIDN